MKLDLDSHAIDIPCPACGKKLKEKIGRLKRNPDLTCPGCGQQISIKADKLRASIDSAQKSLDKLGAALKKLK